MASIAQIADAVCATLNAAGVTFAGQPVAAVRAYRPRFELAELKTPHVVVVPRGIVHETLARDRGTSDVQIDVGVLLKLAGESPEHIDPAMALVEQIAGVLRGRRLEAAHAAWVRTENVPIYSAEHLEQARQFTSVLTVTYRVFV